MGGGKANTLGSAGDDGNLVLQIQFHGASVGFIGVSLGVSIGLPENRWWERVSSMMQGQGSVRTRKKLAKRGKPLLVKSR